MLWRIMPHPTHACAILTRVHVHIPWCHNCPLELPTLLFASLVLCRHLQEINIATKRWSNMIWYYIWHYRFYNRWIHLMYARTRYEYVYEECFLVQFPIFCLGWLCYDRWKQLTGAASRRWRRCCAMFVAPVAVNSDRSDHCRLTSFIEVQRNSLKLFFLFWSFKHVSQLCHFDSFCWYTYVLYVFFSFDL